MINQSPTTDLATKADIQKIEYSLKKFATRTELKKVEKSLRQEILRVEEKVENLEENISAQMKQQHGQVMTAISNFAGRVETLETENEIGSDQIRRLEKRVITLESTA